MVRFRASAGKSNKTVSTSWSFTGDRWFRILLPPAVSPVRTIEGAQKTWRRIDGHNQLPKLMLGVKFADGIEVIGTSAAPQTAA